MTLIARLRRWFRWASIVAIAPAVAMAAGDGSTSGASVLGHTVNLIDGTPRALSEYEGKVVLIVNVASQCGLTPQYEGLQKLYEGRREKGLVVLGFPANDFKGQEPGSNSEIAAFCSEKYGVSFPMFEKIAVLGDGRHPLFKQLSDLAPPAGGAPSWNFTKYLVDRKGNAVQRFDPRTSPEDPALVARIDALLAEKP